MRNHKTIKLRFKNKQGYELVGKLELPIEGDFKHLGIFSHCFTCSKEFFAPTRISKALADKGIAMLRFDFMGLGESEGNFAETTFTNNVEDIISAYKFLSDNYRTPDFLVGHSMGGANMLAATKFLENIKLVATIASPRDPAHVLKYFKDHQKIFARDGKIDIDVAGRKYTLNKSFLDDLAKHDVAKDTKDFRGTVLVFQSKSDDMVSYENAIAIYERATEPKHLIDMNDASHMLDRVEDAQKVANTIYDYLGA